MRSAGLAFSRGESRRSPLSRGTGPVFPCLAANGDGEKKREDAARNDPSPTNYHSSGIVCEPRADAPPPPSCSPLGRGSIDARCASDFNVYVLHRAACVPTSPALSLYNDAMVLISPRWSHLCDTLPHRVYLRDATQRERMRRGGSNWRKMPAGRGAYT